MQEKLIKLKRLHEGQQQVLDSPARFKVIACGRRWGKTTLVAQNMIDKILEGESVAYFVPIYKYMKPVWTELLQTLRPMVLSSNKSTSSIEFINGGLFEGWTTQDDRAGQSRKYHHAYIDEAGDVDNLEEVLNEAILPTLLDYQGGLWLTGTPRGRNHFHTLFLRGLDPLEPDWESFHFTSYDTPFINHQDLDNFKGQMTESAYNQEIMATFNKSGQGVFKNVEECSILNPMKPQPGHRYLFGIDWGRANDFTVISVFDVETRNQVHLERFKEIDWDVQLYKVKHLADLYRPSMIVAENNSMGSVLINNLRKQFKLTVSAFDTTNDSKHGIVDNLALALQKKTIKLLNDPVQKAELHAFKASLLPSGKVKFSAPSGQHDDTVMATAIAYWALGRASRPVVLI